MDLINIYPQTIFVMFFLRDNFKILGNFWLVHATPINMKQTLPNKHGTHTCLMAWSYSGEFLGINPGSDDLAL